MITGLTCLIAAAALLAASTPAAGADAVADFYKGKTVTIVVAHEPGTGFDIYARSLQRHLRRHIPGNPAVVVQNMPGAGGITAANWLYNAAPADGTVLGTFVHTVAFEPLTGNAAARYETAKFTWIGNMEEGVAVCGVSPAAGIARFEDMRRREVLIAGAAAVGALTRTALAVRNLFGARMKIVAGYKGTASIKIAISRGEVHGVCSVLMSTLTSAWRDDYEAGNFRPIIQLSGRARLGPDIPHVDDYVKSDEDRGVHALIFNAQALAKLYAAPPGIPGDRRDALRAALLAAMQDPAFLAETASAQMDISPMSGHEVEAFIAQASRASPATIERVKQAYAP
jgi:tripartite-type tricarboxylate transporter receptor subunit TctC